MSTHNEDASKITGAAAQMGMSSKAGPWCQALLAAAHERDDIIAMSADLKKYTDLTAFAEAYPERYVEVGMAEQNLVMAAAGIARAGLTVVATSFAAFLAHRGLDFATMQIALSRSNVKLVGAAPGANTTFGPSHACVDDLSIWRAVPNMVVLDPVDPIAAGEALTFALEYDGPVYMRQPFNRAGSERVQNLPSFRFGQAAILREGGDVAIVAAGDRVRDAVIAAQSLAARGVSATVVRVETIKPFDSKTVAEVAARIGKVVTVENHSVFGGLFSATSEAIVQQGVSAVVRPIAINDVFPPFGTPDFVAKELSIRAQDIVDTVESLLS